LIKLEEKEKKNI